MRLGLIVNPIAGIGGPLAMKGSDGELGARALAAGARGIAGDRAATALGALSADPRCTIITSAGAMGEDAARQAGLRHERVHVPDGDSRAADTIAAVQAMVSAGAELITFAGGDGTARDIVSARIGNVPVIGIPAGVKMHSAIFATSPAAAGVMLKDWLAGGGRPPLVAEVLDRDASGHIRLYGTLTAPRSPRLQASKAIAASDTPAALEHVAASLARELANEPLAIVGPGATMMLVKQHFGGGTLLGVDAYSYGTPLAMDADAATLNRLVVGAQPRLALGVIGGQGFLLGRGNQQISAEVIRRSVPNGLIVMADANKLAVIRDGALLMDSGDPELDRALQGFVPVRTAIARSTMMRIRAA